ncbi:MAG: Lipocalin family protein [Edaphobacter sp.]|nr:Lipocalin family protein [Edaphobacter sp.]
MNRVLLVGGAWSLCLLSSLTRAAPGQTVSAVPSLELSRYIGTWHEIARFPNKVERKCVGSPVVLLAPGDKSDRFQIVTSCQTSDGIPDAKNADGKIDKSGGGKLKITYTRPFAKKYWVLAVGGAYDWALVGDPNHKSLWVLSRTSKVSSELLYEIEKRAAAQGFDMAKLVIN